MPLTQVVFGKLEAEGIQSQYRHDSISLVTEPLQFVMTRPSVPSLDIGPPAGDHNLPV